MPRWGNTGANAKQTLTQHSHESKSLPGQKGELSGLQKDSGRYIDLDTSTSDPNEVKQIIDLLFIHSIKYLDHFDRSQGLEEYLNERDIIYRKYIWDGPGIYLLWMPSRHRMIYRSDILLERELQFMIALDEHLKPNSEGETDRTLIYLS